MEDVLLTAEQVGKIALEIFGEERVWIPPQTSDKSFSIYVHFPEITIRNSHGASHKMLDLITQVHAFNIDPKRKSGYYLRAGFLGCRMTCSLLEAMCSYGHSHLPELSLARFNEFCLGASAFANIMQLIQMEPTESNWYLLFLSIQNYLSWESLEGGPYFRMEGLSYHNTGYSGPNEDDFQREARRLLAGVPRHCWDYTDRLQLIENHPDLREFYHEYSQIRQMTSMEIINRGVLQQYMDTYQTREIHWKEGQPGARIWKARIYCEDLEQEDATQLSQDVVEKLNLYIKQFADSYTNHIQYEQSKARNKERTFREDYLNLPA